LLASCGNSADSQDEKTVPDTEYSETTNTNSDTDSTADANETETVSSIPANISAEYQDNKSEIESFEDDKVIEEKPLFSVDLNFDGITEDFFICSNNPYDEFCIVMYDDSEKKHISDKTTIHRTDKIDIYKNSAEDGTEYYYAVFLESGYESFLLNCLYTGNINYPCFGGRSYGESLTSPIYCFVHNSKIYKEDFDTLIADTQNYLYKYDNLEYATTIDLTDYFNADYSEEYIRNINICDGMKEISIYNLENDIFGRSIKLSNGTFSYYANESSNIEIYNRPRRVWEYNDSGEAYIAETPDDYDYLLCLKSSDEKNVELIYLGNKAESLIVSYYCYSDTSNSATQEGIDRDIEDFNSIMNDSAAFLKGDGWEYVDAIEM
jgi:hypothetical protein